MKKIKKFWQWFTINNKAYFFLDDVDIDVKQQLLDDFENNLHTYCPNIYFEIGGFPDSNEKELIITAEGDKDYFNAVEELISAAPEIPGWTFIAFKTSCNEHFESRWDDLVLNTEDMYFLPLTNDDDPDIGLRIYLKNNDLIKDNETLTPLLYKMLDTIIGEKSFALDVSHIETALLPDDPEEADLFPILEIPNYITWHKSQPKK